MVGVSSHHGNKVVERATTGRLVEVGFWELGGGGGTVLPYQKKSTSLLAILIYAYCSVLSKAKSAKKLQGTSGL